MENRENQIEEIQGLLIKYFRLYGYKLPDEVVEFVACDFYENNIRKIPQDSVVLTREELHEQLNKAWDRGIEYGKGLVSR